jgi:hypothetical protein
MEHDDLGMDSHDLSLLADVPMSYAGIWWHV